MCLDADGPYQYGIYKWALPVVSSSSIAVKILYPIFWGLMTLRYIFQRVFVAKDDQCVWNLIEIFIYLFVCCCSTFGNDLEPTSQGLEVLFSISAVLSGLMLFTLLIGNIQVII